MQASKQSIFRRDAVRRYAHRNDRVVLAHYPGPRTFLALWCVLGVLLCSQLVVWLATGMPAAQLYGLQLGLSR